MDYKQDKATGAVLVVAVRVSQERAGPWRTLRVGSLISMRSVRVGHLTTAGKPDAPCAATTIPPRSRHRSLSIPYTCGRAENTEPAIVSSVDKE